jgi:hypothetical protein
MGKTYLGYVVHAWGLKMSAWIVTALTVAVSAISATTAVNAGPCAPGSTHNCLDIPGRIDFSAVPEISKQIAGDEKGSQKPKERTSEPPTPASYTGPIFGKPATRTDARRRLFLVIGVTGVV